MCLQRHRSSNYRLVFSCSKNRSQAIDKNRIPYLETKLQHRFQDSNFIPTNGCKVDINDHLLYFFQILKSEIKSAAAQF